MKKLILSLALLAPLAAMAAGSSTGTVGAMPKVPGAFIFIVTGTTTGQPACASGNPGRFALDPNTADGREYIGLVKFAAALGRTVNVSGTGTCSIWGDTESVVILTVNP